MYKKPTRICNGFVRRNLQEHKKQRCKTILIAQMKSEKNLKLGKNFYYDAEIKIDLK